MCHTCKDLNNQPKDSDEPCATDGESAELGAILSQIRLAQSSLHFYATLYRYSLYIHLCAVSTSLHVYTEFSLHLYALYICHIYVLFIIYLLHLHSIHIYMLSTFYAPLCIYASLPLVYTPLHLCAPLHLLYPLHLNALYIYMVP